MDKDWAGDVKKFAPDADDSVIKAIVRYCGIALQKQDSSLVSYSDPVELGRVRQNFLKKKLALTDSDEILDAAIARVGERMKGVNFKNRVTVYYLLLEDLGLLHMFRKGDAPVATVAATVDGASDDKPLGIAAVAAGAAATAAGAMATGADAADDTAVNADTAAADVTKDAGEVVAETADIVTETTGDVASDAVEVAGDAGEAVAEAADAAVETAKDTGTAALGVAGAVAAGGLGLAGGAMAAVTSTGAAALVAAGDAADGAKAAVAGAVNGVSDAASATAGAVGGLAAGAVGVAGAGAAAVASGLSAAAPHFGDDDETRGGGLAWLWWLLLGLGVLALLWWLFLSGRGEVAPKVVEPAEVADPAAPVVPVDNGAMANGATPAPAPAAIPAGAGIVSETRDGKPFVKVYFDTGKAVVVPAFDPAAAGVKAYLDANPAAVLGVSGFNDPTGNAAANAALSKRRAEAVQASLTKAGVPAAKIELIKPAAATDAGGDNTEARRVEVYIK